MFSNGEMRFFDPIGRPFSFLTAWFDGPEIAIAGVLLAPEGGPPEEGLPEGGLPEDGSPEGEPLEGGPPVEGLSVGPAGVAPSDLCSAPPRVAQPVFLNTYTAMSEASLETRFSWDSCSSSL